MNEPTNRYPHTTCTCTWSVAGDDGRDDVNRGWGVPDVKLEPSGAGQELLHRDLEMRVEIFWLPTVD